MKAPFPYFGGKARVADLVWERLGDVEHYVEPFAGSLAVLLARPEDHPIEDRVETANDADGLLANFWRAVQHDPEMVAAYADWPVNEADLTARHLWLVGQREGLTTRLMADPDWYDPQAAGWWVWGISAWIGSGWCAGTGPWHAEDGYLVKQGPAPRDPGVDRTRPDMSATSGGRGIHSAAALGVKDQIPLLSGRGAGVHASGISKRLPHLSDPGTGVHRKIPELNHPRGVHCKLPNIGDRVGGGIHKKLPDLGSGAGKGVNAEGVSKQLPRLGGAAGLHGQSVPTGGVYALMAALQHRLRRVRVACGDWSRVTGPSVLRSGGGTCGVFLDPPYSLGERVGDIYAVDGDVAAETRAWAIANGDNPKLRIALCGYDGEHSMPAGWHAVAWKANGGYGNQGDGRGRDNSYREVVWFSPACLREADAVPAPLPAAPQLVMTM